MNFNSPLWLIIGLIAGATVLIFWHRYDRRQRADLSTILAAQLLRSLTKSVSPARKRWQRGLYLGAVVCAFAALAEPQWGFRWEEITHRGNYIVFAVDTSRSMLATDVKPDRLARAKLAIDDITAQLDGDAIGIVAFSGSAYLACPITLDYRAFHATLNAIDTHTIARGGTNISMAIRSAQIALRRRPGSDKILILLTDGEDLEGDALLAAKAAAKEDGLRIFTVGIGTAAGELIALPADEGGGFVKDEAGTPVESHLDEAALKAIAAATGGAYAYVGRSAGNLEEAFKNAFSVIAKHDLASRRQKNYTQRYQWPLAVALILLLMSLMIGSRRRTTPALVVIIALSVAPAHAPHAAAKDSDIRQPVQQYNAGTSAYRAGRFPAAMQAFQHSIRAAPSSDPQRLKEQQDAYYNLGNTLYRAGQKTEKSTPQDTRQNWSNAIKAFGTALQLRPDDADSKYNRDFVQRKLDQLSHDPPPPGARGRPPPVSPPPGSPPKADNTPKDPPPVGRQSDPGQMSTEDAQQLLDSAKGDERAGLKAPAEHREPGQPPDQRYKNW